MSCSSRNKLVNVLECCNNRAIGGRHSIANWKSSVLQNTEEYYSTDLKAHFGCVNAIEFSRNNEFLASGGDDRRVMVWPLSKALTTVNTPSVPVKMSGEHHSNIFCLGFNATDRMVISGGNDGILIIHDVTTEKAVDTYLCADSIYSISTDPTNEAVFVASSQDSKALIYDLRSDEDPVTFSDSDSPMHSVQYNPAFPRYLATVNSTNTPRLWDIRNLSRPLLCYRYSAGIYKGMSVSFNQQGTKLLVIGRQVPPLVYDMTQRSPIHRFHASAYYSACTIKSCCWAGPDNQYIATGSDNFGVFMWRVPDTPEPRNYVVKSAARCLKGHRSLVNQVRYNDTYCLLASSGVEKIIKLWSPFAITHSDGTSARTERSVFSDVEYISMSQSNGFTHNYSNQSMEEDTKMIAFFDTLVRRQLEVNSSDSDASEEAAESLYDYELSSESSSVTLTDFSSNTELIDSNVSLAGTTMSQVIARREQRHFDRSMAMYRRRRQKRLKRKSEATGSAAVSRDTDDSAAVSRDTDDSDDEQPATLRDVLTFSERKARRRRMKFKRIICRLAERDLEEETTVSNTSSDENDSMRSNGLSESAAAERIEEMRREQCGSQSATNTTKWKALRHSETEELFGEKTNTCNVNTDCTSLAINADASTSSANSSSMHTQFKSSSKGSEKNKRRLRRRSSDSDG